MSYYTALDLARVSGVAHGQPFAAPPTFETWVLAESGAPLGDDGLELMTRLRRHLVKYQPTVVFIESPLKAHIAAKVGTSQHTTIRLNGLVFLAMTVCRSMRVPTTLYERQTVLEHFTGRKSFPDTDAGKRACKQRIRQIWRLDVNFDEADAGALLHYGCAKADSQAFIRARAAEPPLNRRAPR